MGGSGDSLKLSLYLIFPLSHFAEVTMTQIKRDKSPWAENLCHFSFARDLAFPSLCIRTMSRLSTNKIKSSNPHPEEKGEIKVPNHKSFRSDNEERWYVLKGKYFSDCWTGTKAKQVEVIFLQRSIRKVCKILRYFLFYFLCQLIPTQLFDSISF